MKEARAVLTPELAQAYARDGVVRLPGAIAVRDADAMATTLRRKLAARRDRSARPSKLASREASSTPWRARRCARR